MDTIRLGIIEPAELASILGQGSVPLVGTHTLGTENTGIVDG